MHPDNRPSNLHSLCGLLSVGLINATAAGDPVYVYQLSETLAWEWTKVLPTGACFICHPGGQITFHFRDVFPSTYRPAVGMKNGFFKVADEARALMNACGCEAYIFGTWAPFREGSIWEQDGWALYGKLPDEAPACHLHVLDDGTAVMMEFPR